MPTGHWRGESIFHQRSIEIHSTRRSFTFIFIYLLFFGSICLDSSFSSSLSLAPLPHLHHLIFTFIRIHSRGSLPPCSFPLSPRASFSTTSPFFLSSLSLLFLPSLLPSISSFSIFIIYFTLIISLSHSLPTFFFPLPFPSFLTLSTFTSCWSQRTHSFLVYI